MKMSSLCGTFRRTDLKMTFRSILGSGKDPAKSLIHGSRVDYILLVSQMPAVSLEYK
jgi:hypothetical protein